MAYYSLDITWKKSTLFKCECILAQKVLKNKGHFFPMSSLKGVHHSHLNHAWDRCTFSGKLTIPLVRGHVCYVMYSLLDMFSQSYAMKFISSNFNFFSFNSCFRLCSHFTLHTYQTTFCAYMKRHPAQCEWWQHWTGNKLFTHLKHLTKAQCFYRLLNSWKSLDNCPAIFQTWKRYGKYRYLKSGITVKSLGVFFFSKLQWVLY